MAVVRNTRKIYIANISRHARERDIGRLFEDSGRIASLEHKGNFGFIEYETEQAAEHAIRRFHDHDFMGKRLIVKPYRYRGGDFRYNPDAAPNPAKFRGPRSQSYRLYITGLDDSTSWQDVKDFARTGGRSVCYTDVYTRHGKKEGVIEYYKREDFEYALRYLDRARLNGCRVRVFDRQPGNDQKEDRSRSRDRGGYDNRNDRNRGRDDSGRQRSRSRDRGGRDYQHPERRDNGNFGGYDRNNGNGGGQNDDYRRDRGDRERRERGNDYGNNQRGRDDQRRKSPQRSPQRSVSPNGQRRERHDSHRDEYKRNDSKSPPKSPLPSDSNHHPNDNNLGKGPDAKRADSPHSRSPNYQSNGRRQRSVSNQ